MRHRSRARHDAVLPLIPRTMPLKRALKGAPRRAGLMAQPARALAMLAERPA